MTPYIYVLLVLLLAGLVVGIIWRRASRRHTLPCPVWLHWLVELDNPFTKTNRAAVIVRQLELRPGMVVLDMGCGPGRLTLPLAREVGPTGKVVAVDIQAGMLQRLRDKARTAGLANIEFIRAAAGEAGLQRDCFDRALLVTVLGEIPDRGAALKEIMTALKPGGILSLTEIVFDPHFQRRQTVRQLALAVGFQEAGFFGNPMAYTIHLVKPDSD